VVYVTNTKPLVIDSHRTDIAIDAIHSRINDFYIFAGIVITLLLAINVGVFIRAEDEVEKHIKLNFETYRARIKAIHDHCEKIYKDVAKKSKDKKNEN